MPVTTVGAAGTTSVITGFERGLAEELPITLVATTEKLYVTLGESEPITQLVAPVVVHVAPAGLDVTWYPVMGVPSESGATQDTVTEALPTTAVGAMGVTGAAAGVPVAVGAEASDVPAALVAVATNW